MPRMAAVEVDLVITDLGVFAIDDGRLRLVEIAPDVSIDEVRERTEADFTVESSE